MPKPVSDYWPDRYSGCRALVIGASGFIGRWVASVLGRLGATLWLVGRDTARLVAACEVHELHGTQLTADLAVPGTFTRLYREVQPDVVFNLAGYGVDPAERDQALARALNVHLVEEIATAVAARSDSGWPGLRLVHVGSAAEYGLVEGTLSESSAAAPTNLYGQTKLEGTRALTKTCQQTGLRAITARLFTVYGPGERAGRLLPSLLAAARSSQALPLTAGDQLRDFTYVGDVAEGLLRLGTLTAPVSQVVNVATGKLTSVRGFVECAAAVLGLEAEKLQFGALPYRRDDIEQGPVETSLLRQLLDWVPTCSIHDGIRQTVDFETRASRVRA